MSSFRIPSALARLLPTLVGGTERSGFPKGGIPQVLDGGARPGRDDNFRTQQAPPPGRPPLAGDERPPVKSVEELVPPGLEEVAGQEDLAHRFGNDAALLSAHLKPSQLSGSERATRLWAFFAAYAEAAAGKPPQEEAKAAFKEALEGQGFAGLRDANTAKDGVDRGMWVLNARGPDEARERAASVRLEPPPEVRHSEAAARQDASSVDRPADQALSLQAGARSSEALRGTAVPVALESREAHEEEEDPEEALRKRARNRRLGPMMLWNVLHRFRSNEEDGAVADANWDRAAFGAVLALAAIALMVAALVSL
ncbi:Immediate early protein ICP0 [Pyxidicoccus trucidator]|uniref:Immediate early protein ICP0 n=1 Tax=Pyxidicoccus trucidator TaxID=2709662 RepID=UPI0019670509|nr:Immediate early protein ICP0 [Pyxidicoccus trucidator]